MPFLLPTPPPLSFPFFSFSFFSLLLLFFFLFRFLFVSFSFPFRFFRVRPRPFSFFSFRFSLVSFFFALFWPCFLFSELSFLAPPFCLSRRPAGSTPGGSDLHVLGTGGVARALAEGPTFAALGPISALCWPYVRLRMFAHVSRMLPQVGLLVLCSPRVAVCCPSSALCWPMSALGWPYVGRSWPHLAPMLALSWPYVTPSCRQNQASSCQFSVPGPSLKPKAT